MDFIHLRSLYFAWQVKEAAGGSGDPMAHSGITQVSVPNQGLARALPSGAELQRPATTSVPCPSTIAARPLNMPRSLNMGHIDINVSMFHFS